MPGCDRHAAPGLDPRRVVAGDRAAGDEDVRGKRTAVLVSGLQLVADGIADGGERLRLKQRLVRALGGGSVERENLMKEWVAHGVYPGPPGAVDRILEREDECPGFDWLVPAGGLQMDAQAAPVGDLRGVRGGRPDHLDASFLNVPAQAIEEAEAEDRRRKGGDLEDRGAGLLLELGVHVGVVGQSWDRRPSKPGAVVAHGAA